MRGGAVTAGGGAVAVDLGMTAAAKRQVIITSLFFILGFSLVFVSLGASATFLGQFLMERLTIFGKIAGVLLIIFGLHTMGVFKIGWLLQEKRVQTNTKPSSMLGATVVGISFAFGWTPCIGPILSAILLVAAQQESVGQGIVLLVGLLARPRHPVPADGAGHQPVLRRLREDPPLLPRHRDRLGRADDRHRRADLHQPLHDHRAVADAVPADVLESAIHSSG